MMEHYLLVCIIIFQSFTYLFYFFVRNCWFDQIWPNCWFVYVRFFLLYFSIHVFISLLAYYLITDLYEWCHNFLSSLFKRDILCRCCFFHHGSEIFVGSVNKKCNTLHSLQCCSETQSGNVTILISSKMRLQGVEMDEQITKL